MFIIGLCCSVLVGVSHPLSYIIFADIVNEFTSANMSHFVSAIKKLAGLCAVTFVVAFFQMFCLQFCARRQSKKIRSIFFSVSILSIPVCVVYLYTRWVYSALYSVEQSRRCIVYVCSMTLNFCETQFN